MIRRPDGPLRRGWTTGACATAAAKAAYAALLTGRFPDPVTITLPKGTVTTFALALESIESGNTPSATAGVIKDAGDDPDVTHGALVVATVRAGCTGAGVVFRAGAGVGVVTKPGLPIAVSEPAINPVPRRMIRAAIAEIAQLHDASNDVEVEIAIPGGETLASRTWNPRLGIVGGLSILGTTGIVIPFSCAAWIHSIHRGIDVARASGTTHIAACTGSTSEAAVRRLHGLPETAMIDMGDFAGGTLKYLRTHPVARVTIGGGFAKLAKLAQGYLDLHSGRSSVDFSWLAEQMAHAGAGDEAIRVTREANSAMQVLEIATAHGLPLADAVAGLARRTATDVLAGAPTAIEVLIFDRNGDLVGTADGW